MSTWRFLINAGSGWVDLTDYNGHSLVPRESIELRRDTHNKGKATIDTLSFELLDADPALIQTLYNQKTYDPIELVVERDGATYFTGFVRPVDSFEAKAFSTVETAIVLEAVDVLWKLQRTLDADYTRTDTSVDTIVRDLLQLGGFTSSELIFPVTLTQIVAEFQAQADDDEILDVLNTLLFEYRHCLRATPDGNVDLFGWQDPGTAAEGTFDESIDSIRAEKTDEDYGYIEVSHYRRQTTNTDSDSGLVGLHETRLQSNLQSENSFNQALALDFATLPDGADVLRVSNLQVRVLWGSTFVDGTGIYQNRGGAIGWYPVGASGTFDVKVRYGDGVRFDLSSTFNVADNTVTVNFNPRTDFIYNIGDGGTWGNEFTGGRYSLGDVRILLRGAIDYRQRSEVVRQSLSAAGSPNARTEKYAADYIYSSADGSALAEAIFQLRQYGSKVWTIRSASKREPGAVVNVEPGPWGLSARGRIRRVLDSQRNADDSGYQEYVYTVESLEAAETVESIPGTGIPSIPAFPVLPGDGADKPSYGDLGGGIDGNGPLQDLPAPALSVSATTRKASLSVGYAEQIVSGSLRVELQISDDDSSWYSLGPGGAAADSWKGLLDEWTEIVGTSHTHDQLPLGGDAGNPLQTTYYYRARIRTNGLVSDWSASAAVVVSPVLEGDIGADSVTANKIAANAVTAESIAVGAVTADKITVDDLAATGATIAGWKILTEMLASDDDTVLIRRDKKRFEIVDTMGNVKAAFGFLDGVDNLGPNDYGMWIASGNVLHIEGGGSFDAGDYSIGSDAAYVVLDGVGNEIVRLGSMGFGNVGARIGDPINGQGLSYETATNTLTVAGRIIIKDIVIDEEQGLSGLSADRQRRLEISSEKLEWYEVQDGVERKVAELSDRADTRAVRFTKHVRVGTLGGLPAGTVAYYDCNDGVPIGSREGGLIEITDTGATLSGYSTGTAAARNNNLIMGG